MGLIGIDSLLIGYHFSRQKDSCLRGVYHVYVRYDYMMYMVYIVYMVYMMYMVYMVWHRAPQVRMLRRQKNGVPLPLHASILYYYDIDTLHHMITKLHTSTVTRKCFITS